MEYRKLGPLDLDVSILGFGASSLGGVFKNIDEGQAIKTVETALDQGINYIDCSPFYGLTKAETVLGKALKTIDRDRYILSTKCGRYDMNEFDFSPERVIKSVDESLTRMNVDHIDILFCHDIEFVDQKQIWEETLPALHKLKETGKVKHVGISGLPLKTFENGIANAPELIDIIMTYCRYSLNDTGLANILPALEAAKIAVVNAAPTSMGLLTNQGPPEWHPAPQEVKNAAEKAAVYCRENGGDLSTLGLQFSTAHPGIPTTAVSTANPERIINNVKLISEETNKELLAGVQEILAPVMNQTWASGLPKNNDLAS